MTNFQDMSSLEAIEAHQQIFREKEEPLLERHGPLFLGNHITQVRILLDAEAHQSRQQAFLSNEQVPSSTPKPPQSQPEKPGAKITNLSEARDEKQGLLGLGEVLERLKADPSLLHLSGAQLAAKVGTSKSTANRAKGQYGKPDAESAQPTQVGDSDHVELAMDTGFLPSRITQREGEPQHVGIDKSGPSYALGFWRDWRAAIVAAVSSPS